MPILPKIMHAPAISRKQSGTAINGPLLEKMYWLSTFLLAAAFIASFITVGSQSDTNWPEALLLLFATAGTLVALARQLPSQNVFLAALIIAVIGGAAHLIGAIMDMPFGPFMFGVDAGPKLLGRLPWSVPLLWVVMVLNSRGVARLILRPWRKTHGYGFWLIGLTAVNTMILEGVFEPFATHIKHCWIWTTNAFSPIPYGAPLSNWAGWFLVTLLILAFVTPCLINKQLSKRSRPDYHPLAVWLGTLLLCATGTAMQGYWITVAVDGIIALLVAGFAIRGGRW